MQNKINVTDTTVFYIHSPIGFLEIITKQNTLYSIIKKKRANVSKQKLNKFSLSVKKQLAEYFSGRRQTFNIPLANRGTDFQKKVWSILRLIPYGQTNTYGEIASFLNSGISFLAGTNNLQYEYLLSSLQKLFKTSSALRVPRAKRMSELLNSFCKEEDLYHLKNHNISVAESQHGHSSLGRGRAVGQACARNPFLIVVPCHRVLSQKGLGGFAYGLTAKKKLLKLEQTNKIITYPNINTLTV